MPVKMNLVLAGFIGAIFGMLATKINFLQSWTLIPWGLVNLGVGYFSNSKKDSLKNGAIYGFFLGLSFMIFGYNGTDPVLTKLPFFALIGLVCAVFGLIISWVGFWGKNKFKKKLINYV